MRITLIVAMDRNRLIGAGNRLPWHLPADLAHFKRTTLGKPVLMGRRTFKSIGRPLPGRHNIVLTRDPRWRAEGVSVVHSTDEALRAAGDADELMVIGGAELYRQMLPRADRIHLTQVGHAFEGDTWFPELAPGQWRELSREDHAPDERNPWPYSFRVLERVS